MKSKIPIIVIIAIILMGVLMWVVSAIRMSGGVPPEQAEALAEEAERECVLQGHPPDACPEMVGTHHRDCLEEADRVDGGEGARVESESYLDCMLTAFGEPEGIEIDAGEAAESDTSAPDAVVGDDVFESGDADAADEEAD